MSLSWASKLLALCLLLPLGCLVWVTCLRLQTPCTPEPPHLDSELLKDSIFSLSLCPIVEHMKPQSTPDRNYRVSRVCIASKH